MKNLIINYDDDLNFDINQCTNTDYICVNYRECRYAQFNVYNNDTICCIGSASCQYTRIIINNSALIGSNHNSTNIIYCDAAWVCAFAHFMVINSDIYGRGTWAAGYTTIDAFYAAIGSSSHAFGYGNFANGYYLG